MDSDSFMRQFRAIGSRAVEQAARRGSVTVEAEHILLALALDAKGTAAKALASVGLTYDSIVTALDEERSRSLAFAGVTATGTFALSSAPRRTRPRWGTSVREVMRILERLPAQDRRKRPLEIEMLIAILQAELGTVPRALSIAGVDKVALVKQFRAL